MTKESRYWAPAATGGTPACTPNPAGAQVFPKYQDLGFKIISSPWATHGGTHWVPHKRQSLPPEACGIYSGGSVALPEAILIFFPFIPPIFSPCCFIHHYLYPNWLEIIDPCPLWNCSLCTCRYCVSSVESLHRAHPQPFLLQVFCFQIFLWFLLLIPSDYFLEYPFRLTMVPKS